MTYKYQQVNLLHWTGVQSSPFCGVACIDTIYVRMYVTLNLYFSTDLKMSVFQYGFTLVLLTVDHDLFVFIDAIVTPPQQINMICHLYVLMTLFTLTVVSSHSNFMLSYLYWVKFLCFVTQLYVGGIMLYAYVLYSI